MKLVALDFETANNSPSSACSLGISIFEEGELKDSFEWMIRPPKRYSFFIHTPIHGITFEDVEDSPEFYEYYDRLTKILEDCVVVAHNAMFDIGVLNAMCDTYGLDHILFPYLDTVRLSRILYPDLINHKLNTVSEYLGIDLNHHNAGSDALACLMIVINGMSDLETDDFDVFLRRTGMKYKYNR